MNYIRVFNLTLSALFGVYLCQTVSNKWQNNILKINVDNRDLHRKDYLKGYLRTFNLNLHAESHNSPYSILEKWRNNIFKVNARHEELNRVNDENIRDQFAYGPDAYPPNFFNEHFQGDLLRVVGAVGPMPTCAIIKYNPDRPTNSYISYYDYVVVCDTTNKTPFYSMQGVAIDTADLLEHRHCESFKIVLLDKPADYHFGKEKYNAILTIQHIEPAARRLENGQYVCDHCDYSNFWKEFYRYIRFLTGIYETVYICSGPMFLQQGDERPSENGEHPSHFFKIIFCQNDVANYRMECYIIENKPMKDEIPDIRNFVVSREELQGRSGMIFFPHLPNRMVKDNIPLSTFFPAPLCRPRLKSTTSSP